MAACIPIKWRVLAIAILGGRRWWASCRPRPTCIGHLLSAGRARPVHPASKGRSFLHRLAQTEPSEVTVAWYGGAQRRVALVSGTGPWYRSGQGLVPLRWVQVRDREGTHRQECFFSTDLSLRPSQIVSAYTAPWAIEVTFHQARAHLGLATPRHRTQTSVLRTTPCLFGLFSVVALMFAELYRKHPAPARSGPGYDKPEPPLLTPWLLSGSSCGRGF